MRERPSLRPARRVLASLTLALIAVPAIASARTETLRWNQTAGGPVEGYVVVFGTQSGELSGSIDLPIGSVVIGAGGIHEAQVSLGSSFDESGVFFALYAYHNEGGQRSESALSNEAFFPGPPPPSGDGGATGGEGDPGGDGGAGDEGSSGEDSGGGALGVPGKPVLIFP